MARDISGNYTLPAAYNPVVTETAITIDWANTTLDDVSVAMTGSLSRSGFGGMLAPLILVPGSVGLPGLAFDAEPSLGLRRAGAGDLRVTINADVFKFTKLGDGSGSLEAWDGTGAAWGNVLNTFADASITGTWIFGSQYTVNEDRKSVV